MVMVIYKLMWGKNKLLEYRLIIKLNSLKSNYNMMINIVKTLGRKG
jgi:hypothetical protein